MARSLSFAECFEALQNDGRTTAADPRSAEPAARVVAADGAILERSGACVSLLWAPEKPAAPAREIPRWTLEEMRRILRLQ